MSGMPHTDWMPIVHWIGVALTTPAAAVVLVASWRELNRTDTKETR
jgi:hypothetical protein